MDRWIFCLAVAFLPAIVRAEEDYVITIDGVEHEIGLGKEASFDLPGGKKVAVKLKQKEVLRFRGELFTFDYKSDLKPARTNLGEGVHQTMLVTPQGTMVLVQEYAGGLPQDMVKLMIPELTDEEVKSGLEVKQEATKRLVGGKYFVGKKVLTIGEDEELTRYVVSYGNEKNGLLVVTMIDEECYETEQYLIDQFWDTLTLQLD